MSTFRLIILLCVVVSASSKALEDSDVEDRIHADTWEIDDMKAKYGDRPYQVFVTTEWENALCGGVLLEMNYVLTAAHCVNGKKNAIPKDKVLVKAGIIKNRRDPYEQKQLVTNDRSHIKFNPNWNGDINKGRGELVGDLAILKLNKKFEKTGGRAAPIKVYNKKISTIVGKDVTLSGWGIVRSGPRRSNAVYTTDLLVSTVKHANTYKNGEMLELSDEEGNVSCGGDSGGPATYKEYGWSDDALVGITHAGIGDCGHNGKQSFYTSVEFYLDWVCDNIDEKVNMAEVCEGRGGGSTPQPIDGGWSSWGSYGSCSKSCGGGTRTRSRSCTNPSPSNGGRSCSGSSTERSGCNNNRCPSRCKDRSSWKYCYDVKRYGYCNNYSYYKNCRKRCGRCL